MCGELTYEATFRGNPISLGSAHMQYDTTTRLFSVYAEPFALIGVHPITVQAHLTDYAVIISDIVTAEIDLIDPCIDPKGINSSA